MLTTAANNALDLAVTVPGSVEASASDGDVWLTGMVGNRFQRDAAEQAVAGVTGVRGIVDDIEIFSDLEAADVSDLVQDALFRYGFRRRQRRPGRRQRRRRHHLRPYPHLVRA